MNIDTGELKRIQAGWGDAFDKVRWVEVPKELEAEAEKEIKKAATAGEKAFVPLDGGGPLSQFRRDQLRQREKQKAKRRRNNKAARKARRR
jgi:hypothetical protein